MYSFLVMFIIVLDYPWCKNQFCTRHEGQKITSRKFVILKMMLHHNNTNFRHQNVIFYTFLQRTNLILLNTVTNNIIKATLTAEFLLAGVRLGFSGVSKTMQISLCKIT